MHPRPAAADDHGDAFLEISLQPSGRVLGSGVRTALQGGDHTMQKLASIICVNGVLIGVCQCSVHIVVNISHRSPGVVEQLGQGAGQFGIVIEHRVGHRATSGSLGSKSGSSRTGLLPAHQVPRRWRGASGA